jgi:histidyl-tRNA synthetase
MFKKLRQVVESFGYQEYDAPILEPLDIYLAKTGEEIVNQQLYTFEDKGDRKVAIRPEMTPSVSRMVAGRRQELAYPLRWYSIPNLWRYERPQHGRLREHWQLNVDIFGIDNLSAEQEIIQIADGILKIFGAKPDSYVIRINSRQLVDQFLKAYMGLSERQIYETSKLIDRWHKIEREEFHKQAREILTEEKLYKELIELLESRSLDTLPSAVADHQSVKDLGGLMEQLKSSGVNNAEFDFSVIRGMDYYSGIVFEVFDTNPENIRSMFGGGRYDGLVGLFGVEPVPTVGFGMGDVTLQDFLLSHNLLPNLKPEVQLNVIFIGDINHKATHITDELREKGLNIAIDFSGRKLDAQIKSAVKSGVRHALFIGEQELDSNKFKLRDLQKGDEKNLSVEEIVSTLSVAKQ